MVTSVTSEQRPEVTDGVLVTSVCVFYDASITIYYIFSPCTVTVIAPTVAGLEPTVAPEAMRVYLTVSV
jgi:hypothetical protein